MFARAGQGPLRRATGAQQLRRRVNKNRQIGSADAKTMVSHLGQGEKRQQKVREQQRKSLATPNGLAPAGTFGGCHPKWHWGARNWGEQWDSQLNSTSKILRAVSQGEDDLSCCQMWTRSRTTVLANTKNFMLHKVFISMLAWIFSDTFLSVGLISPSLNSSLHSPAAKMRLERGEIYLSGNLHIYLTYISYLAEKDWLFPA